MTTFFSRKYSSMLLALLLIPALSFSQENKYSLSSIVDSAHNFLPVLRQKAALLEAAKARVTDTRHSLLPQLKFSEQVNLGSDNSMAGSYFTFGITPSTSAGIRNENDDRAAAGNLAVLYSEYELYNFGLNKAKVSNARAYVNLQETDLQKESYLLEMNVAKVYFNLVKNSYKLNADRKNIERYERVYKVINAVVKSGIAPGSDTSMAMAELSKARIRYNETRANVDRLKEQLSFLSGIPSERLQPDTTGNEFMQKRLRQEDYVFDTAGNPLITYFERQLELFASAQKVIGKSYLPKLVLGSSVWARGSSIQYNDQYKDLQTGLSYQRYNYAVGLAVTYNLFNGLYRHDKLLINKYQLDAAKAELEQQTMAITSASAQADKAIVNAEANLAEMPIQLRSAESTYAQKVAQYKAGLISLIDLTNATFVLYRSHTDFIEAQNDWYLAQLDKAAATGNLHSFIQTINW